MGWWSKVHIFDKSQYEEGSDTLVFYIDLDMIITGSLDNLCGLMADKDFNSFATLTVNEIHCETAEEGYNSSIMLFRVQCVEHLYETLSTYYQVLVKFLMRFDHYLEMLVWDAGLVQELCPGELLDYCTHFQNNKDLTDVPSTCSVIAFPRSPKPHEI